MKKQHFITELKSPIELKDFSIIRNLYQPIIGTESVALYGLLVDYHEMSKYQKTFYSFAELISNLKLSISAFELSRKKLESVGLIRSFEKADGNNFIIMINKPMTPEDFRKNSLLYKLLIKEVGDLAFERFEFSSREDRMSKDEFSEVTVKFTDVFNIPNEDKRNTLEFKIPHNLNRDDALKSLAPLQFANFLENKKPSPSMLVLTQDMQNNGLSTESINHIFNYSFEVNGKIVQEHVKVIFKDLIKKNVKSPEEIKSELRVALLNRGTHVTGSIINDIEEEVNEIDATWDEIFNSVGEF